MAKIHLNGKKLQSSQIALFWIYWSKFKLNSKKIAIELNGTIIQKTLYKKKILKNKDRLEVVHFIGGG